MYGPMLNPVESQVICLKNIISVSDLVRCECNIVYETRYLVNTVGPDDLVL